MADKPPPKKKNSLRLFKKTSSNNKITLYIASRDLVIEPHRVERVVGVLVVDPEYAEDRRMFGQITVTFRYGREDEEIMGLRFFNENIINIIKIWPPPPSNDSNVPLTMLQKALVQRLGPNAVPFHIELFSSAPPSVILVPAKPYDGAPVGTSYDVRVFLAEGPNDIVSCRNVVSMGLRVTQGASGIDVAQLLTPSPSRESFRLIPRFARARVRRRPKEPENLPPDRAIEGEQAEPENEVVEVNIENEGTTQDENNEGNDVQESSIQETQNENNEVENETNQVRNNEEEDVNAIQEDREENARDTVETTPPAAPAVPRPTLRLLVEKSFLLNGGKVQLESWLDKSNYHHGETIVVNFRIRNTTTKKVRRIKAYVIQCVDVCMFDNGKFKNMVAFAEDKRSSVPPGQRFQDYYTLLPRRVLTKNWIALEDSVRSPGTCLASTVICTPEAAQRRSIYSIFVSYYVKVTLFMNRFGGELSVKLPFSLSNAPRLDAPTTSVLEVSANRVYLEQGDYSAEVDEIDNRGLDPEENANQADSNDNVDSEENKEEADKDHPEADDSKICDDEKDDSSLHLLFIDNGSTASEDNDYDSNAAIGNHVSNSQVHVNPEGRQHVMADVCVNIIENKLCESPRFEGPPQVRVTNPEQEEFNLIVRYPEADT